MINSGHRYQSMLNKRFSMAKPSKSGYSYVSIRPDYILLLIIEGYLFRAMYQ